MKASAIIGIVVVIAIIIGVVVMTKGDSAPEVANQNTEQQVANQDSPSSMRALLASQKPQKCEFRDETPAAVTEGTVYIANGKMRGDFIATASDQTTGGHMIIINNTIHSWTDAYPTGFTMSFDSTAQAEAQGQTVFDADKQVDYSCEDWTTDESKFTLPTNITFQNMNSFAIPPVPSGQMPY